MEVIDDCKKYGLTREDFIKYRDFFLKTLENSWKQENSLAQEVEESVKQKHDKSIKDILVDEEEMSRFLEQFMEIEVKSEDLEEQKNSYINKQFEKRKSDILYKIKNKEIYILVEHQSRVDKRMPRRIFEYCMGVMMTLEKMQKEDDGSNPLIIPIVVYTGENRWSVKTCFAETQKTYGEIIEMILRAEDEARITWLKQLIKYVFIDKLGEDAIKILKILERGEMDQMEELFERIERNEARIRRQLINKGRNAGLAAGRTAGLAEGIAAGRSEGIAVGRTEGRLEGILENMVNVIKNMLQQNVDEEKIMKYTNAKKEDIEKVKKELGMC